MLTSWLLLKWIDIYRQHHLFQEYFRTLFLRILYWQSTGSAEIFISTRVVLKNFWLSATWIQAAIFTKYVSSWYLDMTIKFWKLQILCLLLILSLDFYNTEFLLIPLINHQMIDFIFIILKLLQVLSFKISI